MTRLHRGFSLVELMITVAIIGLLASIAVPNMYEMSLKAKRAEAVPMVEAIVDAGLMRLQDYDPSFESYSWNPSWPPGKASKPWNRGTNWERVLGFEADGELRCCYWSYVFGGGYASVYGYAYCDLDGDNIRYQLTRMQYQNYNNSGSYTWTYPNEGTY